MSQQGDRSTGHEDDWWGQLYDDSTGDTGPAPAADTLDDRFASASETVGQGTMRDRTGTPSSAPQTSAPPDRRDPRRPGTATRAPAPWEPPSTRPPGSATFPPGPTPPGFWTKPPASGSAPQPPVSDPASQQPADASLSPSTFLAPSTPPSPDYVGSGPPTYDSEPAVLSLADPDDLGDLVPDTVLDGARYGACTLRAVSVRGDSARFRGEPRRDCLLTARFGGGDQALVLVAMATGRRGTPGAHRAAAEACHLIGRAVGRSYLRLGEDIRAARRGDLKSGLQRLTDRSFGMLRVGAAEQGVDPVQYTADLRCLLLPADPDCRTRVFFGVGAGGLFRLREGEWQDIEPQAAETAGEAVAGFGPPQVQTPEGARLTMDPGIAAPPNPHEPPRSPFLFRAFVAHPGDTLLLCTSGLADPLRGEPLLAEHLTDRWSTGEAPGLAAFLADALVRVKGYADDRTAAAVWEA